MTRICQTGFEITAPVTWQVGIYPDGTQTSGSSSRDTTVYRSGAASLKLTGSGSAVQVGHDTSGVGTNYWFFAVYKTGNPSSTQRICQFPTNGSEIRLNSSGQIGLFTSGGAQVGSWSPALSNNAWHLIEYCSGQNPSIEESRVNGESLGSRSYTVTAPSVVVFYGVDNSVDVYIDDVVCNDNLGTVNNSWCGSGSVILMKPISDEYVGYWTGAAGGTTNLWEAINNTPPIGDATADDTKRIECVDKTGVNGIYDPNMGTLASVGVRSKNFVVAGTAWLCHGEESGTGSKTADFDFVGVGSYWGYPSASITFGNDLGAIGTYPTNWAWTSMQMTPDYSAINISTNQVLGITKRDTTSRSATVCGVFIYLDVREKSDPGYRPPAALMAPFLAM